jgi:methyl-accepting chemotaxis protein
MMARRWAVSFGARLRIAFAVLVVAVIGVGWLGISGMARSQEVLEEVAGHRWARVRNAYEATALVNTNLQSRLTLFFLRDSAAMAPLLQRQAAQSKAISAYYDVITKSLQSQEERALFEAVTAARATYLQSFTPARALLLSGQRARAATLMTDSVVPRAAAYLAAWEEFAAYQARQVDEAAARSRESYRAARTATIAVVALTALLAVLFGLLMVRSVTGPLARMQQAAHQIATGDLSRTIDYESRDELGHLAEAFRRMSASLRTLIAEIDVTASEVSSTAAELAASSEEVTASTEDVAGAAHQLAAGTAAQQHSASIAAAGATGTARHAAQVTLRAAEMREAGAAAATAAARGSRSAQAALESMAAIRTATQEAEPLVAELGRKAGEIAIVTSTVEAIAAQTNLLSLNAAIEAARAGEQGRGFAVVADEVRKLSLATGQALDDIRALTREMHDVVQRTEQSIGAVGSSVVDGERVIRSAAEALTDIGGRVEGTLAAVAQIAELAAEQHGQAETLAREIERIAAPAATNASLAEQVSASAEEQAASMEHLAQSSQSLASLADRLKEVTSRFVLGTAEEDREPPAPAPAPVPAQLAQLPAAPQPLAAGGPLRSMIRE